MVAGPEIDQALLQSITRAVGKVSADQFGSFLVVDVWQGPPGSRWFSVASAGGGEHGLQEVKIFCEQIAEIDTHGLSSGTEEEREGTLAPSDLSPLLEASELAELGAALVAVEIPSTIVSPQTGDAFPEVMRDVRRELFTALQRLFFSFAQNQTTYEVDDYRALGRRAVQPIGWDVDRELSDIALRVDFLLNVTPVNTESAWDDLASSGFSEEPHFHYRPLTEDPDLLKRQLFDLEIDTVHDPTLLYLLRDKRAELDRQLTMLEDRDTARFLHGSLQLYGELEERTVDAAFKILRRIPESPVPEGIDAAAFAELARKEIARYAFQHPELTAKVIVRDDVPGLVAYRGDLIIGSNVEIPKERAMPLLHHEVGTHVLTSANGRCQPLRVLMVGLPGYEETQEGLAVFAEYIAGGLSLGRLRLLAGRVIAVKGLIDGAGFLDVFHALVTDHGFSPRTAWKISMRVFRSGGLTKDAIYLSGLINLLEYLAEGGSLEPLFAGKMRLDQVPLIEELTYRQILVPPALSPLWLEVDGATERLAAARSGRGILDLALENTQEASAR
jgi:uncharacterized protein (TIGR02421 family)